MPWRAIERTVSEATGASFTIKTTTPVGGGCINEAYRIESSDGEFFVKLNHTRFDEMFSAEFDALKELAKAKAIRVPNPICTGSTDDLAFLVMEYVDFGPPRPSSQAKLGHALGNLHKVSATDHGWHRDNTIGSTPQINTPKGDWIAFYRERRLRPQFQMAERNGRTFERADQLMREFDHLFSKHKPTPSLLHGDLWSGNVRYDRSGEPVIFDPATFHGDRESDFALGAMFGGFTEMFFRAYDETYPRNKGWKQRLPLYRLYHELNHFNLFGGGYASSAEQSISEILASL